MLGVSYLLKGGTDVLLGRWERGNAVARRSLALFREAGNTGGMAVSLWLLCCLALAEGERGLDAGVPPYLREAGGPREAYVEAQRLAQESVAVLREMRNRNELATTLAVLAAAERGLGDLDGARHHCEALQISAETGAFLTPLFALPAIALVLADRGEQERAVELYALASRYPFVANSRWFESVFGRHIAAIAASLPPGVADAARKQGRARNVQATLEELIAEFET